MRFWFREIAGWGLVGLGLAVLAQCVYWLTFWRSGSPGQPPQVPPIVEAGLLMVIGIFLFRGGIHLLKVAVAARICTQAREGGVTKRNLR